MIVLGIIFLKKIFSKIVRFLKIYDSINQQTPQRLKNFSLENSIRILKEKLIVLDFFFFFCAFLMRMSILFTIVGEGDLRAKRKSYNNIPIVIGLLQGCSCVV